MSALPSSSKPVVRARPRKVFTGFGNQRRKSKRWIRARPHSVCNLAGSLARRGNKVLVVDADPQGTATRWAASADDEKPFPASVVGLSAASTKVHREVKKFVPDY